MILQIFFLFEGKSSFSHITLGEENEWTKHLRKAELKNANQLIVFGNAELKIAIHQFSAKYENKNCKVLSKNWKNLHLTMLILACTNYIS